MMMIDWHCMGKKNGNMWAHHPQQYGGSYCIMAKCIQPIWTQLGDAILGERIINMWKGQGLNHHSGTLLKMPDSIMFVIVLKTEQ